MPRIYDISEIKTLHSKRKGGNGVVYQTKDKYYIGNLSGRLDTYEPAVTSSDKSGTATLDFGSGNKVAEVLVTGVEQAMLTSRVMVIMRLESTLEHPVDDMQIDPIRVLAKNLIIGVGFTIYGEMDNAPANGTYKIDWSLTN